MRELRCIGKRLVHQIDERERNFGPDGCMKILPDYTVESDVAQICFQIARSAAFFEVRTRMSCAVGSGPSRSIRTRTRVDGSHMYVLAEVA